MEKLLKALCAGIGWFCQASELSDKIEHMSHRMVHIEERIDGLEDREQYWMPRDLIDTR